MKIRLSVLALSTALIAACGGDPPQPETPPPPEPAAPEPSPAADPAPAGGAAGAEAPKKVEAPPAKPNKEKIAARWSFDFSGEVKTLAEEDAKKKKNKDEKKQAEALSKAEAAFTKKAVEFAGDTLTVYDGDKATKKVKYEVVKDEGSSLTIKFVGKDEISKKDMAKEAEMVITFKDDSTIEMKDPVEKDQAKAKMIVLKKK